MGKRYYSPHELMRILGLSRNTIYKYLAEGSIRSTRLGHGRYRVPAGEVARLQATLGQTETMVPAPALVPPPAAESAVVPSEEPAEPTLWNCLTGAAARGHQGADLFDWMIALLSIIVGSGMFLFSYYGFAVAREWQVTGLMIIRFVLLGYGFAVLAATVMPIHSTVHRVADLLGALVFAWFAVVVWPLAYVEASVLYLSIALTLLTGFVIPKFDARAKFGMLISLTLVWGTVLYLIRPDAYQSVIPFFGLSRTVQVVMWGMAGIAYASLFVYSSYRAKMGIPVLTTLAALMYLYIAYFMTKMGAWDRVLSHVIVGVFYFLVPYYEHFEVNWVRGRRDIAVEGLVIMMVFVVAGAVLGGANNVFRGVGMHNDLHGDVAGLSSETDRMAAQAKQEVVALAGSRLLMQATLDKNSQMITDVIRDYLRASHVLIQASVINPEGEFVEYYPHTEEILLTSNVSFREYFVGSKAGAVFMSPRAFHGGFSGAPWLIVVAAPMYTPKGELVGVVAARFDLQRLQDLVGQYQKESNEHILILDQYGRALAATEAQDRFELFDAYLHFVSGEQQRRGATPLVAYVDSEVVGKTSPYMGWTTSQQLAEVPWYVAVVQTAQGEGRVLEGLLVIGLLFTVMLILFFILAWRQRIRTKQRLEQHVA